MLLLVVLITERVVVLIVNNIVKDHFLNPRNLGKIKKPTHTAKHKSGFCGDTVEVYAIVDDNRIIDIKYNVFGCHAVIAASSVLSEYSKDKTLDEVKALTYDDVIAMLGGSIEPEKEQCVKTAITTFQKL